MTELLKLLPMRVCDAARRTLRALSDKRPFVYPAGVVADALLSSPTRRQRMAGIVGLLLSQPRREVGEAAEKDLGSAG